MRIILVTSKATNGTQVYKNLTRACKALKINYSTATKVINGSCDIYETDEFIIHRLPIR